MLVTSRSYDEYTAMFGLTDDDLSGVVVDCAAGASSFTAQARERGQTALAVDPAYAAGLTDLAVAVRTSAGGGSAIIGEHPDRFIWDWYGTRERKDGLRAEAASRFLADVENHPTRYVAASLLQLPFRDHSADLLLCSHLLFTWSDQLDDVWHRQALTEMLRVCRQQIRIFPLVVQGTGEPVPFMGRLINEVDAPGLRIEMRPVPYEFQRGADTMLVITRL